MSFSNASVLKKLLNVDKTTKSAVFSLQNVYGERDEEKLPNEKSYKYLYTPGSRPQSAHMCEDVKKHAFHF